MLKHYLAQLSSRTRQRRSNFYFEGYEREISTPMKSAPHIGRVIWHDILQPLSLSVTKTAKVLGVRPATLSDLVNGKAVLTAEMALRIH
jgi:hypothetical protein